MADDPRVADRSTGRDETPQERMDRNYNELLQELRVAQTGVQILLAFLLTLPFTQRWTSVTAEQRTVYLITMGMAALAVVCLIAPVSHHRILFRRHLKDELVDAASNLAGAGLVFLWLAVVGAIYLIFDVVVGTTAAAVAGSALAAIFVAVWYVYPILKRNED